MAKWENIGNTEMIVFANSNRFMIKIIQSLAINNNFFDVLRGINEDFQLYSCRVD